MRYCAVLLLAVTICGCEDGFGTLEAKYVAFNDAGSHDVVSTPDATPDTSPDVQPPPPEPIDKDGDGITVETDCDDTNSNVTFPIDWLKDGDLDGWGSKVTQSACTQPEGYVAMDKGGDCDGGNASINPDATEVCDSADNDCDGKTDEDSVDAPTWYVDNDLDGYGTTDATIMSCEAQDGFADNADDCDDANAVSSPGAEEFCDEHDNDCDGATDEGLLYAVYPDKDSDGYGNDLAALEYVCKTPVGQSNVGGDCNDEEALIHPKALEVCDGADNDCDGEFDEGVLTNYYPDNDSDGYGASDQGVFGLCSQLWEGLSLNKDDCNDDDANSHPGASEVCDNVDNNCDGLIYSSEVDGDLCDDNDDFTVDSCSIAQGKCLNIDVTFTFTCKLPAGYSAANGYFCGSAAFFTGDDVNEIFFTDGNLELPAKNVCAIVHENDATLYVNSFVAMEGDPSSLFWVGGEYVTVTDSLTGKTATGTPGNVTLLSPGLNFDYVLDDLDICQ